MSNPSLTSAIEAQNAAFMAAERNADAAALGALYTEDAWLLPPGGDMIRGRSQIEAVWASWLQRIAKVKLITVDVVPLGPDAARELGTSVIVTTGHPAEACTGKYIVVWRQVGGE